MASKSKKQSLFEKIIQHNFWKIILFVFIFSVYFSSAVGLYNSVDTPQFFTTESIIRYGSIDLSFFRKDPHFFVYPDIYVYKGQLLSLRGIFFSFLMVPAHFAGQLTQHLFTTNNFPPGQVHTANFPYELAVTCYVTLYVVVGLFFAYQTISEITKNKIIASICVLIIAFASYIWKYSSLYSRQNLVLMFLGINLYFLHLFLKTKRNIWLICFSLLTILAYGFDMFLFISMGCFLAVLLVYLLVYVKYDFKKIVSILLLPTLFFLVICLINYLNYGNIFSNQTNNQFTNKTYASSSQLLSTPIFPTIFHVLFGFGRISEGSFSNYKAFAKEYNFALSLDYAKKYNFFGLFFISPFLLFSFIPVLKIFKKPKKFKEIEILLAYCFSVFILGVILSLKVVGFWGGNQYDIRYFYPYIILLILPLSLILKSVSQFKNTFVKYLAAALFLLMSVYSLFMGWLGVINMYNPSLTGERRIWMDIYQVKGDFLKHSFGDYLNATFMNRENAWIAVSFCLFCYAIYRWTSFLASKFIFLKQKKPRQIDLNQ